MLETLLIVIVAGAGWLVYDALRVREEAIRIAREACERQGLQFLDYTVESARTRLARDAHGRAQLRRTYRFEFSVNGHDRHAGSVVMLGAHPESLQLEPPGVV
ncbi:MAG TPA: DUF3301 domain-containing protein [Casimicrobiaceae bacterium]|nr:DUF3301 domain-containing protein [Casimicrobiaceae bacterium]